jgi:hypothetical protein
VRSRCEHVLDRFLALLAAMGFRVDQVDMYPPPHKTHMYPPPRVRPLPCSLGCDGIQS